MPRAAAPYSHRAAAQRGFTLTELAVSIVLLGMLFVLVLPAAWGASQEKHATQCMDNLRQIGTAAQSYANDHDDWFPTSWDPAKYEDSDDDRGKGTGAKWTTLLAGNEYLPALPERGEPTVLKCPAGRAHGDRFLHAKSAYGMNIEGNSGSHRPIYPTWRRGDPGIVSDNGINEWADTPPSELTFFADSVRETDGGQCFLIGWIKTNDIALRHAGKGNAFFLDSHVESVTKKRLLDVSWPEKQISDVPSADESM